MRFVLGPIPPSETFDAKAAGWTPMVSSADLPLTKVISLVGMIGFILAGYWCLPQVIISMEMSSRLKIAALAAMPFFLMIPLHEFCHCLGYLVPLTSRSLISGMWLRQGFYIVYDSPLQKARVLLMLAAPFALLSRIHHSISFTSVFLGLQLYCVDPCCPVCW
jgi:hypothetical protein